MALFRARGSVDEENRPVAVISIDELLSYRDAWTAPPTPSFDLEAIIQSAKQGHSSSHPLQSTPNAFRKVDTSTLSEQQAILRRIQGAVNKLSESNYHVVAHEICRPEALEDSLVNKVMGIIYEKALVEPLYLSMYSQLIVDLAVYDDRTLEERGLPREKSSYKVHASLFQIVERVFYESFKEIENASEDEVAQRRKRRLANVRLAGELINRKLLARKIQGCILHYTIFFPPSDVKLEAGCELLLVCGKALEEHPNASLYLDLVDRIANAPAKHENISTHVWFVTQNVRDLRRNGWKPPASAVAEAATKPALVPFSPPAPPPGYGYSSPNSPSGGMAPGGLCKKALPPATLDDECEKRAVAAVSESMSDSTGTAKASVIKSFATLLPGETERTGRVSAAYAVLKNALMLTNDALRVAFVDELRLWKNEGEVLQAFVWCLTSSLVDSYKDDCPRFYDRLVTSLIAYAKPQLAVCDFFLAAMSALDAVYSVGGGSEEWETCFLDVWSMYLKALPAEHREVFPKAHVILDALTNSPVTEFTMRTLADFIGALVTDLIPAEDFRAWCKTPQAEKNEQVTAEINLLVGEDA